MAWQWNALRTGALCVTCLFVAGCVSGHQWSKGATGQTPTPPEKTAASRPEAGPPPSEPRPPSAEPAPPASPEVSPGDHWQIDASLVQQRLQLYQQKESEWQAAENRLHGLGQEPNSPDLWRDCRQGIALTLIGYQRLQPGGASANPWEVVHHDFDYFSKGCDQLVHQAQDGDQSETKSALAAKQAPDSTTIEPMRRLFAAGQYQEVITAYEALDQGLTGGGREGQFLACQALVKLGRLSSALPLLTKLLALGGQATDLLSLEIRRLTADVLLSLGHVEEARQLYEGLARAFAPLQGDQEWVMAHLQVVGAGIGGDALSVYRELLSVYLRFDGQQIPPELTEGVGRLQGKAPFADLAKMLLAKASSQAQERARGQLSTIKDLLTAGNLSQARQQLQQLIAVAPAAMQPAINQLETELAQAEAKNTASPQTPATEGQAAGTWQEAMALFEQQKYDQAIAGFTPFLIGDQEAEAKAKIAEASELAAVGMRRQAAALYAKAKKTFDPAARQQGLLNSRDLLLTLIEKYPESSVIDKARQNLKVLETELGTLAPSTSPSLAPR